MRAAPSTIAATALLLASVQHVLADDAKCYPDWSTAAPVVKREKLVSATEVHQQVRKRKLGELIRMTLCEEKGAFVYRIFVQDAAGKVRSITLDARKPF